MDFQDTLKSLKKRIQQIESEKMKLEAQLEVTQKAIKEIEDKCKELGIDTALLTEHIKEQEKFLTDEVTRINTQVTEVESLMQ